jgi:hypothetical protein
MDEELQTTANGGILKSKQTEMLMMHFSGDPFWTNCVIDKCTNKSRRTAKSLSETRSDQQLHIDELFLDGATHKAAIKAELSARLHRQISKFDLTRDGNADHH